jgi:hypothetical protein
MKKYAFIDRDGTLIFEPQDTYQIDTLKKLHILPGVIKGLQFQKKTSTRRSKKCSIYSCKTALHLIKCLSARTSPQITAYVVNRKWDYYKAY